jgi:hypothetical protein
MQAGGHRAKMRLSRPETPVAPLRTQEDAPMKSTLLCAAALATTLVSPWTLAQGWAPGQAYAGVALGQTRAGLDCTGATACDRSALGTKVYGGYMFHPNLGVEVDLRHHGKADVSGTVGSATVSNEFKTYGMGLFALGNYRQGALNFFGKLGLGWMHSSGVTGTAGLGAPLRDTDARGAWGLGLGWDFSKNLSGRIEFERVRVKLGTERIDSDLISAGVSTRF